MSYQTEWGEIWVIVQWTHGLPDSWPRFSYQGKQQFHIHDARHHMATLTDGWHILHAFGYYPPEEWVGNPSHLMNKNMPREPRPEGIKFMNEASVPADHDHSKWDKK